MYLAMLAAAATGTPAWATAAIGAGGLLIGVLATVAGNAYVARTKIKEAEVFYRQRLADSYLATARTLRLALSGAGASSKRLAPG